VIQGQLRGPDEQGQICPGHLQQGPPSLEKEGVPLGGRVAYKVVGLAEPEQLAVLPRPQQMKECHGHPAYIDHPDDPPDDRLAIAQLFLAGLEAFLFVEVVEKIVERIQHQNSGPHPAAHGGRDTTGQREQIPDHPGGHPFGRCPGIRQER